MFHRFLSAHLKLRMDGWKHLMNIWKVIINLGWPAKIQFTNNCKEKHCSQLVKSLPEVIYRPKPEEGLLYGAFHKMLKQACEIKVMISWHLAKAKIGMNQKFPMALLTLCPDWQAGLLRVCGKDKLRNCLLKRVGKGESGWLRMNQSPPPKFQKASRECHPWLIYFKAC